MKTNHFLLKGILLMLLFSVILGQVSAQSNQGKAIKQTPQKQSTSQTSTPTSPTSPPPPPPPPPLPEAEMDLIPPPLDIPDLTDLQKEQIKKSDLKNLEAMTPLRNQMREKRARLATILSTMPFDMKTADQIANEIGTLNASILKLQIRHDQELRNLLTPDQQILFDAAPKPFLGKRK